MLWTGYADPEGESLIGFYALQQAVFDRYRTEYRRRLGAGLCRRPGGRTPKRASSAATRCAKAGSARLTIGPGGAVWAAACCSSHRIAACIFGGDWEDPDLKDSKEIDGYFQEHYGQSMIKVDLGATEKYRYVPGFHTGGTFGVNMHTADDKLFSYNYSVGLRRATQRRLDQHSALYPRSLFEAVQPGGHRAQEFRPLRRALLGRLQEIRSHLQEGLRALPGAWTAMSASSTSGPPKN